MSYNIGVNQSMEEKKGVQSQGTSFTQQGATFLAGKVSSKHKNFLSFFFLFKYALHIYKQCTYSNVSTDTFTISSKVRR